MNARGHNEIRQLYLMAHYYYSKLVLHDEDLGVDGLSLFNEANENARRSLIQSCCESKNSVDDAWDSMIILRDACESLGLSS